MDDTALQSRRCCSCKLEMTRLTLPGHYKRSVDIDVCTHCLLFWFDGTESLVIAGPGVIDLLRVIDEAQNHSWRPQLRDPLCCPSCNLPLRTQHNRTLLTTFKQWSCAVHATGYYQTFASYLTEKGYLRPVRAGDRLATCGERRCMCVNCGAALEPGHDMAQCPWCGSAVSVLDPSQLALAIHTELGAAAPAGSNLKQHKCGQCGSVVDLVQHERCPQCAATVSRVDTEHALAVGAALEEQVRRDYEEPLPEVTAARLERVLTSERRRIGLRQRMLPTSSFELKMALIMGLLIVLGYGYLFA